MTEALDRLSLALTDRYRIERELGAGGMATVYLAEDLKHGRKVAIKVLRPELAAVIGADRFVREIRTIAALQHPHILGLIDSGEVNGTAYYVMPFVEGESLRDRLNREKQLPIPDAIRIAGEAAAALDYAHRHGVIHRDIKPENILLHDGSALVADFGIALAVSSAGGSRMTETGMSLGTPHYMSPEQAMGEREITARSDVYALGAMTYEMLLGEPPFSGPTAQAIVAKVLTEAPRPLTPRRHSIPPEVEDAVLTALEKLPADRFGSAAEFAIALHDGTKARRKTADRHQPKVVGFKQRLLLGLGLVVLPLAAFLLGRESGKSPPAPLTFGQSIKVTWDPAVEALPAMSPDGRSVAYASGTAARMRVFVRSVAGGRGLALTDDTSQVQSHPRWSPDGSRVLFLQGGGVFSVPASGGADTPEVPPGRTSPVVSAAWSPDGKSIGYVIGDSLFVRDGKNESRGIAGFFEPNACQWSPGGEYIACASGNAISMMPGSLFGNLSPSQIVTVPWLAFLCPGRIEHDFALRLPIGIVHINLHEEPVELRFRKRVRAFLLDWVLGREYVKRARDIVAVTRDRHMVLLHGLEQGRLGAGACAVYFVGHQKLAENRTRDESEAALAARTFLQDFAAKNIGRHEVRSELDAAGLKPKDHPHGLDELGLGKPRKPDEQGVTT